MRFGGITCSIGESSRPAGSGSDGGGDLERDLGGEGEVGDPKSVSSPAVGWRRVVAVTSVFQSLEKRCFLDARRGVRFFSAVSAVKVVCGHRSHGLLGGRRGGAWW